MSAKTCVRSPLVQVAHGQPSCKQIDYIQKGRIASPILHRSPTGQGRHMTISKTLPVAVLCCSLLQGAQADIRPSLALTGVTGLIDMPSGDQQTDGALTFSKSLFGPISRNTFSFQITPRLSGSFRYSATGSWNSVYKPEADPTAKFSTYYDRSFDLRYQLTTEGKRIPAITIGLQDFIGTGIMSGEYIAATKTFGSKLKLTAGLGWGRYGSYGAIGAPFGARPVVNFNQGGNIRLGEWFKGDAAPFGGLEYAMNDHLSFKAEYSSDAYSEEAGLRQTFDRKSPLNFGAEYHFKQGATLGIYSLYGSKIGAALQILIDPKQSPTGGQVGPGPLPIRSSVQAQGWTTGSVSDGAGLAALRDQTQKILSKDGIVIEAISVTGSTAQIRIRSTFFSDAVLAIGRTSRAMAYTMPPSVQRFEIVPVEQGVGLSKVVIARKDLEDLEFAAGQDSKLRDRVRLLPASARAPENALFGKGLYPHLTYGFSPYAATSLFDPSAPLQANFGLRFSARYDIAPGLVLSGSVTKKLAGNIDGSGRTNTSLARHRVRTDAYRYAAESDLAIETLTLGWFGKPRDDLYTRVTAGYLEGMYAGVSTEVLWQQVNKPYAIGVELNYVKQRAFDKQFGLQDYGVFTGHVSGYYHFDNGFQAQLDVGRYLAGDVGATLALDREFANGIKVGAFVTMTDMSAAEFGEGSFDKGIRVKLPFAWLSGRPTQKEVSVVLRPLLRDGGARLEVQDRLYDTVRSNQQSDLDAAWGKFWK